MVGLGTVINTAAILAGGVCGALFGRVLSQSAQDTLMKVCGVGTLFIAISGAMEGMLTKVKTGNAKDKTFVNAFVSASLTVCIGAMAIVGSIQDGLTGDYSILATKAVLDLIIIMVMSSSMGKGAAFSAIPVAVLQGSMTALAGLMRPVMTEGALANLSLVGNVLIFCVGINLLFGKKVKVANLLPAIVIAVAAAFLPV